MHATEAQPYRSTVAYYYYYSVEKVARGPDLLPYDNCVAISWQQADVHTQVPKHAKLPILYGYTEEQFGPLAHPCDRRKKMSDEATRRGMQALKESASGLQLQPALPAGLPVSPPHRPKPNGAPTSNPETENAKSTAKKPNKTRGKLPVHPQPQRPVGHHTRLQARR